VAALQRGPQGKGPRLPNNHMSEPGGTYTPPQPNPVETSDETINHS